VRILRYLLSGYFWILFVVTACVLVIVEPRVLLEGSAGKGPLCLTIQIAMAVATVLATLVFARAWWVLWHEQLPARAWCIAASIVSSIAPATFLALDLLAGRLPGFWHRVGFFMVPALAIGIGGILVGLAKVAEPLPPSTRPHLGHAMVSSVLFLYFGFCFISGIVWGVLQFAKHRHLPISYFAGVAICGFLSLATAVKLKQDLRKRGMGIRGGVTNGEQGV